MRAVMRVGDGPTSRRASLRVLALTLWVGCTSLLGMQASAAQLYGVTSAVFEWTAATGAVSAYLIYVARNSDFFPAYPEAIAGPGDRRVTIRGQYGERLRVRVVAMDASLRTGPFSPASDEVVFQPGPPVRVEPFDLDADGRSELLLQNGSTGALTAWTIGATAPLRAVASGQTSAAWTVEDSGDYDGDGRADLMWRDPAGQRLVLCRSSGSDASLCATYLPVTAEVQLYGLGDANNDGRRDFVLRIVGGTTFVCEGAGVSAGACSMLGVFESGWRFSGAGDLDGDGRADLLMQESTLGTTITCRLVGRAAQSCHALPIAGLGLTARGIGDLDGDGRGEIALHHRSLGVLLACGVSGSQISPCWSILGVDSRWEWIGVADYDGDRVADLVFRDLARTSVRIEPLRAGGSKGTPLILPVGSGFRVIAR